MNSKKDIVFIVNPRSGTHGKDGIPRIIDSCLNKELFDSKVVFTEYAGHASEMAKRLVENKTDIVVAVGGDGTVNEVARSLVHTDTALGIIPCGSGNGLARHLHIPMDIKKAVAIINECQVGTFDYGVINGLPFFCTCGMGFDAFISQKFAEAGKRGPITYMENVLREGLSYKPEAYEVEGDTIARSHKAFLIACANASQYGNNAYIAPNASMTDGLMDVIIVEPFTPFDAPQLSIDMFNGTLDKNSKIKMFKAKQIHIHRNKPGAIHYDGDPIMAGTDIDVHIEGKGIKIITNSNIKEDERETNAVLSVFADFFCNLNTMREDIERQSRRIQAINKALLKKLTRN